MADTRSKAAAVLAEQERLRRRRALRSYALVGLVLLVVAAALWLVQDRFGQGDVDPVGEHALVLGEDDAPHTVVIYEDFLCPACGAFEGATADGLEELAADGKVQVEYRPFVLLDWVGDYSERSLEVFAAVLETADATVAKEFHDLLFAEQPAEDGDKPSDDELVALAVEAGADEDALRGALEDGSAAKWAENATEDADDAGVRSTPTVLLDGELWEDGRTAEERGENLLAELD